VDQEDGFQQADVVAGRVHVQPGWPRCARDVQHLRGLPGEPLQQQWQGAGLPDLAELANIALERQAHVVVEPAMARRRRGPGQGQREPATRDAVGVLLAGRGRRKTTHRGNRVGEEQRQQVRPGGVELALRERVQSHPVQATGQCLGSSRQRLVAGRTGQDEPARPVGPVELSLDRIQDDRRPLVLIDADQSRARDHRGRIGEHRLTGGDVIKIQHLAATLARNGLQDGRLAHGPRPLEQDHGLVAHAVQNDVEDPASDQAVGACHAHDRTASRKSRRG